MINLTMINPIVRRTIKLIALLLCVAATAQAGQSFVPPNTGVGIAVGTTGGITVYRKLDDKYFVQGFISRDVLIGADYAFTFPRAVYAIPELTPFIGVGGFVFADRRWMRSQDRTGLGARIPLGIMLDIPNAPVHLHAEITPATVVIPFMDTFADAVLGVRFLF